MSKKMTFWREFHQLNREKWFLERSYHGVTNHDLNPIDSVDDPLIEVETNPYHEEGSVYTHTAMVFNEAVMSIELCESPEVDYNERMFCALAHDLGKPMMRIVKVNDDDSLRVMFSGHDYASSVMMINWAKKHFPDDVVLRLCRVIALHTTLYKVDDISPYIDNWKDNGLLRELGRADSNGRIAEDKSNREVTFTQKTKVELDSDKPWATVMIGLPGSGKSSIAEKYGKVFSTDEKMETYAREELGVTGTYSDCFKAVSNTNFNWTHETLQDAVNHAKTTKEDVVLDATNMIRRKRKNISKQLGRYCNIRFVIVWRDLEDCKACRQGDKFISDDVYYRMISSFSYPKDDEYDVLEHVLV